MHHRCRRGIELAIRQRTSSSKRAHRAGSGATSRSTGSETSTPNGAEAPRTAGPTAFAACATTSSGAPSASQVAQSHASSCVPPPLTRHRAGARPHARQPLEVVAGRERDRVDERAVELRATRRERQPDDDAAWRADPRRACAHPRDTGARAGRPRRARARRRRRRGPSSRPNQSSVEPAVAVQPPRNRPAPR